MAARMSKRAEDLRMLQELLEDETELSENELEAFKDMLEKLEEVEARCLSDKQRVWVEKAHDRISPSCLNLYSSGKVKKGADVPLPEVLKNLPKTPPGRKPS